MSVEVCGEPRSGDTLLLQPRVGWPKLMTVGVRHPVAVDLLLVTESGALAPWPFPDREEITYTFSLDGGADFERWAVHDPAVVLHRFGGSYGPAEFVITPHKEGDHTLWLTIINPWGAIVGEHPLPVTVIPGEKQGQNGGTGSGGIGGSALAKLLVEAGVTADDPAAPDAQTQQDLRIPAPGYADPPPSGDPPEATRPDLTAPTQRDLGYAYDQGYAPTEDIGRGRATADLGPAAPAEPGDEGQRAGLAEWYSVVGLRRASSGNLHLGLLPLFGPGTPPGERVSFTVRCAPADEYGTAFAVVAEQLDGGRRRRQVRSVQSARIAPGVYQVTAELLYPWRVRFSGLPSTPHRDPRGWSSIMSAVPNRLGDGAGPAHLIAAIEISGPRDLVSERIDCVRRLIIHVADQADVPVSYSVICYGPHSINVHNRDYPEVPVTTLAWADTSDAALDALDRLARRAPVTSGYTAAAQIECVLAELGDRLAGSEGRPVIVTAGGRPAHPPRGDASRLIPCVYRNDWRYSISRLARHAGIAYGAIHDNGFPDDLWRLLGNSIGNAIDDFSPTEFAVALGLTAGYPQFLPLPLIDGLASQEAGAAG